MANASLFSGPNFQEPRDRERLTKQLDCIRHIVSFGDWWTIQKLTAKLRKTFPEVGFPENSVQAQLRNLRKLGVTVERRHVAGGLFEYRVSTPEPGVVASMSMEVAR